MKLQLALDTLSLDVSIELLDKIVEDLDIIEVGTPFIIEDGLLPVRTFKARYPDSVVLADVKIMDAGYYEAEKCFKAGADIVTVLGAAHDETISGAVQAAKEYDGKVMVDLINVADLTERALQVEKLGVDYCCVHTAFDVQSATVNPLAELELILKVLSPAKVAVAGGLKLNTIPKVVSLGAEIVVVGGGIINQSDPVKATKEIKDIIKHG